MATLSYLSLAPIFLGIARGDSAENGASGGRHFGSYHLHLRTGTSPTEDFTIKTWRLPSAKLCVFLILKGRHTHCGGSQR